MNASPLEKVLTAIGDYKRSGKSYKARCPAHEDHNPSLSLSEAKDGKVLLKCHAGCTPEAVVRALGLEVNDLFTRVDVDKTPRNSGEKGGLSTAKRKPKVFPSAACAVAEFEKKLGKMTAWWTYEDAGGNPLAMVARWDGADGKTFRPVAKVDGYWRKGDPEGLWPLYRLPDLLRSSGTIYICEGEKAADALRTLGFTVTTSAHGANAAKGTDWSPLAGRDVVILPDNDDAGASYAADIIKILSKLTPRPRIKVVNLPDFSAGGDIAEFVEARLSAGLDEAAIRTQIETMVSEAEAVHVDASKGKPEGEPQEENIVTVPALEDVCAASKPNPKKEEGMTATNSSCPAPSTNDDGGKYHLTDTGNAHRLIQQHGRNLRYCHPWSKWFTWDGRRWQIDATAQAERFVHETRNSYYEWASQRIQQLGAAAEGESEEERLQRKTAIKKLTAVLTWCLKWEGAQAVTATLRVAQCLKGIPILPEQVDRDPWLFNCLSGTINLRTGQLGPNRQEDLITKLAPVVYDPDAKCPHWLKFLHRIMAGNQDMIDYLQRVIGYALTGDVSEQCLWFLYGNGSNGKSTFLSTILAMLGDYGMQAVSDLLMVKNHESHPTERADLFGRRFVATIETEQGKRMAEALMKQLTGGDKIRARKMKQDFFEFDAHHKIFLAANHKPKITGTDHAAWRRIKLMPFTVTIPDEEKDKHLSEKLLAELPGILAWAVRGCLAWQQGGLGEPEEVRQATDAYQAEQDTLARFIAECCFVNTEVRCRVSEFLAAYNAWSGEHVIQWEMGQRMREKNYEPRKGHAGRTFYVGIALSGAASEELGGAGGVPPV